MALHRYQRIYDGPKVSLGGVALNLFYLRAPFDGTITRVDIFQSQASSGAGATDNIYNLAKNGVSQWSGGSRLTLAPGESYGAKTDLSIAVSRGDVLVINIEQITPGGIVAPISLNFEMEDGIDYNGEDGVGIPAGGTTGQILAKADDDDFNSEWVDAPSGGGGSFAHPDKPPATPHAMDDEFDAGSLDTGKWTRYAIDAGNGFSTELSGTPSYAVHLLGGPSSGAAMRGIYQPHSGNAVYRAKLSIACRNVGITPHVLLGLYESATNKGAYSGLYIPNTSNIFPQFGAFSSTGSTPSISTLLAIQSFHSPSLYFEIEIASPNIIYRFSTDGYNFYTVRTEAISARFTTAPDRVVLFFKSIFDSEMVGSALWFRRIS